MQKKFLIAMLSCWFFMAGAFYVHSEENTNTLTLSQAIAVALEKNISLKEAGNQVEMGKIAVDQRKRNFYPDLNLSSRFSERIANEVNALTGSSDTKGSGSLSLSASSSVTLFNGYYDTASLRQAQLEYQATQGTFTRNRQNVIFETIQRFIQVITAGELILATKENLEAQRLQLARIEDFVNAGKRPVTDLYQQKAEIARAEFDLLNAERNLNVTKLLLTQTIGLEPNTDFTVIDPGCENLIQKIVDYRKEQDIQTALANRADLNARKKLIAAAQNEITAAASGFWPKLSFFADFGSSYSSRDKYFNFSHQFFDNNLNGSFGISLSLPIFDKSRTRNSVASARINLRSQELVLEKSIRQVQVEIQQAGEDFRTAGKQLDVAETQVKYTTDALESVQQRYNVNAATMVELTQARTRHLESIYDRVQAKFNLLLRGIALAFYKGDADTMLALVKTN